MLKKRVLGIKWLLVFVGVVILSSGLVYGQSMEEFDKVTASINTPALVDDYLKKNFKWASEQEGGGCLGVNIGLSLKDCAPNFLFQNKKGNCGAFTTFAIHCLRKAGYKAYPLYIHEKWPSSLGVGVSPRDYHIMVLYEDNGKWYTIDRGKPRGPEGIKGPYKSVEDLPYKVLRVDKEY
jgi:hypothetical protein